MTEARDRGDGDHEGAEQAAQRDLRRIAHMFSDFREDPVMREICRLAIKFAQERLISGG